MEYTSISDKYFLDKKVNLLRAVGRQNQSQTSIRTQGNSLSLYFYCLTMCIVDMNLLNLQIKYFIAFFHCL